ncbi:MAG: hypothetical protein ACYS8K_02960 [Planctomycetota bacterium]|jgi:lipopolysaccharide export system protein LptA
MPGRAANRAALAALALLMCWSLPSATARSRFLEGDYSHQALRLEGQRLLYTWEEDGVRVFLAQTGATVRQGGVRLNAPRMVIWFDRALSEHPDVQKAMVRVYAEGTQGPGGTLRTPVRLVEGQQVQEHGALLMHFESTLSFAWNAPLRKLDRAVRSPLLERARQRMTDLQQEAAWEAAPTGGERERVESLVQLLSADEVQVFWNERPISVVYIGDVHGGYGNLTVRADAAALWYDTEQDVFEIYARGNVRVASKPGAAPPPPGTEEAALAITEVLRHLSADEVYINPAAARGLATAPEVRMQDPGAPEQLVYVFRGDEAYLVDSRTLTVRKASVTTCGFARPHYQFEANRAQIVRHRPSTFVTAWDVSFQAGESRRSGWTNGR